MIISQTAVYALKAVLYLAEIEPGVSTRVDDIAAALRVPRNYLSKILHVLARKGVLSSIRGPHGGFQLRLDPAKLTLQQVVDPFDEVVGESGCLLGRKRCSDAHPCAAHAKWKDTVTAVRTFFEQTTVRDLTKNAAILEDALH